MHVAKDASFVLSGLSYSLASLPSIKTLNGAQSNINHQIHSLTFSIHSQSRNKLMNSLFFAHLWYISMNRRILTSGKSLSSNTCYIGIKYIYRDSKRCSKFIVQTTYHNKPCITIDYNFR